MKKISGTILFNFVIVCTVAAQPPALAPLPKKEIKKGNELYQNKQYKDAQEAYGAALMKNPASYHGLYNMGNTMYQLEDVENARKAYEAGAKSATTKEEKARALHNAGNTYMKEEKWQEAVNAFKESLRNDPANANTKYNLAYANAKLKQQQDQNKDDKNQDNQEKQDDKQEQDKEQSNNKDSQEQKGDDEKRDQQGNPDEQNDKEDKQKEERKQQGQPSKLTEQQAENLLNALRQEEKKVQEKKNKQKGRPVILEKDW